MANNSSFLQHIHKAIFNYPHHQEGLLAGGDEGYIQLEAKEVQWNVLFIYQLEE